MINAADSAQLAVYQMLTVAGLTVYDEAPEEPELPCVVLHGGAPNMISVCPQTWKVDIDLNILSDAPGCAEASTVYTKICEALGDDIRPTSQHTGGFCRVGEMDQDRDENLRNPSAVVEVWLECG